MGVLPILGRAGVGKSTLVAHVCNEESVRNYFTQIVFITEYDLKVMGLTTFKDAGTIIHQNSSLNGNVRTLAIIEFSQDVDENAWKQYLASATLLESVVTIIITSRSRKITNFGTTQSLILNDLPLEAYWYFFKLLTFGSVDPKDQPKLESIALEICKDCNRSFVGAHVFSGLLRADHCAQHWCMVRATLRILKETKSSVCKHYVFKEIQPTYLRRRANDDYLAFYPYRECISGDRVPKTTLYDVLFGSVKCEGKFQDFGWKSLVPPYKKYVYTCEVHMTQCTKKR